MQQFREFRKTVINPPYNLASFSAVAQQYEKAKERLLAAQQEKMEAAAELMALRASLSGYLEAVWPEPEARLEADREARA